MVDWNDLKVFLAVAETGSLSAAARQLGVSASTVSRRITAVEGTLGVTLFRHLADGYELTEAGSNLRAPAEQAGSQMRIFERAARDGGNPLSGPVRIDVPELLGQQILIPGFAGFLDEYPEIRLDIRSSVRPVHLSSQEADIVIRLVPPQSGNYKIRVIGKVEFGLYASKGYLAMRNPGVQDDDLLSHRLVGWSDDLSYLAMATWLSELTQGCPPHMRLGTFTSQLVAVESDLGIAVLPRFAAERSGLVRVFEDHSLSLDLWLLIQDQVAESVRGKIVKGHILEVLKQALR